MGNTDTSPRQHSRRWDPFFDLITVLMIVSSLLVVGGTFLIMSNPDVPFNPFPLSTLPAVLEIPSPTSTATFTATFTPSATPTSTPIPPTLTPSMTPTVTLTPSPSPTATYTPTPVLAGLPTATPGQPLVIPTIPALPGTVIITPDQTANFPFTARAPIYQRNLNSQDCDWLSIAGSVTGLLGEPVVNMAVEVAGDQFSEVRFTGTTLEFGQSGFEFNLGNSPRQDLFTVRLLGTAGEPLSDYIYINTENACDRNVAVLEFQQVREY